MGRKFSFWILLLMIAESALSAESAVDYFKCEFYDDERLLSAYRPIWKLKAVREDRLDETPVQQGCLEKLRHLVKKNSDVRCSVRFHGIVHSSAGSHSLDKNVQSDLYVRQFDCVEECWEYLLETFESKVQSDRKVSTGRFTGRRVGKVNFTPRSADVEVSTEDSKVKFWVGSYHD